MKVAALVEHNQIVKTVSIQVCKTNASAAVVFVRKEVVGVGECLGMARLTSTSQCNEGSRRNGEVMVSIFNALLTVKALRRCSKVTRLPSIKVASEDQAYLCAHGDGSQSSIPHPRMQAELQ